MAVKRKQGFKKRDKTTSLNIFRLLFFAVLVFFVWFFYNQAGSFAWRGNSSSVVSDGFVQVEDQENYLATVCLDPGHGGDDDPGATHGEVIEREVNLIVAQKLANILSHEGYKIVFTRTSNDAVLDNTARATICNDQKSDILVSIHHNDYIDYFTDYSSAIYNKEVDIDLATMVLESLSTELGLANNGLSTLDSNLLAKFSGPAVLTEAFFISSDYEWDQLEAVASTRLDTEASGLATGIKNYFESLKAPTTDTVEASGVE